MLPSLKKKSRIRHHPALPYSEIGEFMRELREQNSFSARALELAILTAARTGEVIGALPEEFDLDNGVVIVFTDPRRFGLMVMCQTDELQDHPLIQVLEPCQLFVWARYQPEISFRTHIYCPPRTPHAHP